MSHERKCRDEAEYAHAYHMYIRKHIYVFLNADMRMFASL